NCAHEFTPALVFELSGRCELQFPQLIFERFTARAKRGGFLFDLLDVSVDRIGKGFFTFEDLYDRMDGQEVEAPEQCGKGCADNRQSQTDRERPGVAHGAEKVPHGRVVLPEMPILDKADEMRAR